MLTAKKREFLDKEIARAALNKVGTKAWTRDDEKKAVALIRDALLKGNSIESMMYVLLRSEVLGAIEGSLAYEFDGNLPALSFVEDALRPRSAKERCELLTLMFELLQERLDKKASFQRHRDLVQGFVYLQVRAAFPAWSEGWCVANMLDDAMRNWKAGIGEYSTPGGMLKVSKALEKLAADI